MIASGVRISQVYRDPDYFAYDVTFAAPQRPRPVTVAFFDSKEACEAAIFLADQH
jgi:hypothetical protein